jgi:hypothetical protein
MIYCIICLLFYSVNRTISLFLTRARGCAEAGARYHGGDGMTGGDGWGEAGMTRRPWRGGGREQERASRAKVWSALAGHGESCGRPR